MKNFSITGTGFVIYDEYHDETGLSNNVPTFLNQIRKLYEETDDILDAELLTMFEGSELFDSTDTMDTQDDNMGVFEDLKGNRIDTIRMLCIRNPHTPSMFHAPYPSEEAFISAVKTQLKTLDLLELLPENFDWKEHIGTYRYVVTSL